MDLIMERDVNLQKLEQTASNLEEGSHQFQRTSVKLKKKMWWENQKMKLVFAGVAAVFVLIVIILIASQTGSSDDSEHDDKKDDDKKQGNLLRGIDKCSMFQFRFSFFGKKYISKKCNSVEPFRFNIKSVLLKRKLK